MATTKKTEGTTSDAVAVDLSQYPGVTAEDPAVVSFVESANPYPEYEEN